MSQHNGHRELERDVMTVFHAKQGDGNYHKYCNKQPGSGGLRVRT